jgi:hypothetical protein
VTVNVTNTGDAETTQSVALDVGPLGSDNTTVTLAGGNSTETTLSVSTDADDNGTYTASVSTDDDADSTEVTVLTQAAFAVVISDTSDPVAGEDLAVTAEITNTGDTEDTRTVTLDVPGLGSNSTELTLDAGASTTETLSVSTGAGDAGTYTAEVSSGDDTDSTTVTVLSGPEFAVTITGASDPVAGQPLNVTAEIANTGDVEATQTVTLDVPGLGTDSVEVTLGAGVSTVETLAVTTEAGDAGEYTAEVSSGDDTDSTGVSVLEPASLAVNITDTSDPVAGQSLNVTAEIANTGDTAATGTITLDVGPLGENSTGVELAGGASVETTLTVDTGPEDAGEYTATVSSPDDSDSANVTVSQADQFLVDIVEMNDTVIEGDPMTMTVEVENIGQGPGTQTLTVDVEGHDSVEMQVDLAAGQTVQETMEMSMESQKLGTYNVTAATADDTDQETIEVRLPTLPGQHGPPQDVFGDGLHEDVDGDGQFDIFDVQAFFTHLDSPEIQEHAWAYNFWGTSEGEPKINILDVQRMFDRLT